MKKKIAIVLSICMLLCAFPISASADTMDTIDTLTARNIATFYASIWPFEDADGNPVRFGTNFTLSHSESLTDANGDEKALGFTINGRNEEQTGYVVISLEQNVPCLAQIGLGALPEAGAIALTAAEDLTEEQVQQTQQENQNLLNALREMDNLNFQEKITWLFDQIIYRLRYYLDDIWYGVEWDAESANRTVEAAIREYAAENGSIVTSVYSVDKNYCVPHSQGYFFQSEEYYDGICGVAAWQMLLAYYRDACGYTNLPDDFTMYKELMVIMDDITERVFGGLDFLSDLNDIVTKYTDYYIPHDLRAHEMIGTLDAGIAIYLYQKGYDAAAQNVLQNLSINIPLLTSAKRALLLSDLRAELADWIYAETDGQIRIITGLAHSAQDVVVRSLKRGEPVVIGNWFSLNEYKFTNHYFTAVGLYNIEGTVQLADGIAFSFDRQYVEVYDTWTDSGSSFIDLENLTLKAAYNANSLTDLGL